MATEKIEGAARIEQSDREEDDDDEDEARYAAQNRVAIESSDDSDGADGCGGTPTGIVRERLSWQPVQTFDHATMSQEEISKEISSMLVRDLKITGFLPPSKTGLGQKSQWQ